MPANNPVKPLPFPGESPTVALAMAAGEKFGFHEDEKPARKGAKPKKSAKARKAAAPRKATKRATAKKPARKPAAARKPA